MKETEKRSTPDWLGCIPPSAFCLSLLLSSAAGLIIIDSYESSSSPSSSFSFLFSFQAPLVKRHSKFFLSLFFFFFTVSSTTRQSSSSFKSCIKSIVLLLRGDSPQQDPSGLKSKVKYKRITFKITTVLYINVILSRSYLQYFLAHLKKKKVLFHTFFALV